MPVIRIDDGRDGRLADYAGVREPARLRERGLVIVEGRLVVRRILDAGHIRVRSLLLNEAAAAAFSDLIERLPATLDVYVATREAIEVATGFDIHRGCLAVAERPAAMPFDAVLERNAGQMTFEVVAPAVIDAGDLLAVPLVGQAQQIAAMGAPVDKGVDGTVRPARDDDRNPSMR